MSSKEALGVETDPVIAEHEQAESRSEVGAELAHSLIAAESELEERNRRSRDFFTKLEEDETEGEIEDLDGKQTSPLGAGDATSNEIPPRDRSETGGQAEVSLESDERANNTREKKLLQW